MKTDMTIGTDPEFFIWDNKLGTCVPPIGATSGTKEEPEPWKYGWSLQIDGFALELNSPVYPLNCWSDVNNFNIRPIRRDFDALKDELTLLINQRMSNGKETDRYSISSLSSFKFDEHVFDDAPTHCKVFGCDPDFDPYSNKVNDIREAAEISEQMFGKTFRTCSGHISVGWHNLGVNDFTRRLAQDVARRFGNVTSYSSYDCDDSNRRQLYGKLGAYRPKPFGVELRQPSNLWLTQSKYKDEGVFKRLVWDLCVTFKSVSKI